MNQIVINNYQDRVYIGLDYFDASINRVAAWVIGVRNAQKALLRAYLRPASIRQDEYAMELYRPPSRTRKPTKWRRSAPFGDEYCQRQGVPRRRRMARLRASVRKRRHVQALMIFVAAPLWRGDFFCEGRNGDENPCGWAQNGALPKCRQPIFYFGWPTVTRLPDGTLAMAASGFRLEHVCPFGKGVIAYSKDEGESWTHPAVVIDTPLDDRDCGLTCFGEGKVILTSFNKHHRLSAPMQRRPASILFRPGTSQSRIDRSVHPLCRRDGLARNIFGFHLSHQRGWRLSLWPGAQIPRHRAARAVPHVGRFLLYVGPAFQRERFL